MVVETSQSLGSVFIVEESRSFERDFFVTSVSIKIRVVPLY